MFVRIDILYTLQTAIVCSQTRNHDLSLPNQLLAAVNKRAVCRVRQREPACGTFLRSMFKVPCPTASQLIFESSILHDQFAGLLTLSLRTSAGPCPPCLSQRDHRIVSACCLLHFQQRGSVRWAVWCKELRMAASNDVGFTCMCTCMYVHDS